MAAIDTSISRAWTPRALFAITMIHLVLSTPRILAQGQTSLHRPVDLVTISNRLLVANRDRGSITEINTDKNTLVLEKQIGTSLSSLVSVNQNKQLLASDPSTNKVYLLDAKSLDVLSTVTTPVAPISICSIGNNLWAVACSWARRICIYQHDISNQTLQLKSNIDLPFSPNRMLHWPGGDRLIVADQFGRFISSINTMTLKTMAIIDVRAHNIRGLALESGGKGFAISHQMLNEAVPTEKQRVFWGTLLQNIVRSITFKHLMDLEAEASKTNSKVLLYRWSLVTVGDVKKAATDPGSLLQLKSGRLAVALSGTHEIGLAKGNDWHHIPVGLGPRALAEGSNGRLYVASTFSDSIAVIDTLTSNKITTISLGDSRPATDLERGEMLFHDGRLSLDGWLSCHSCHSNGHTNGMSNDNFGDQSFQTSKQIPSLLGVGNTGPWGWLGNKATLAEQIDASIANTMHGKPLADPDRIALSVYLRSLKPAPSIKAARNFRQSNRRKNGRKVFEERNCTDCHKKPNWTSPRTYDVGLVDERNNRKFNPPALRGLSQRSRFLHDGRAATLKEVFGKHGHKNSKDPMTQQQLTDLIQYLDSL